MLLIGALQGGDVSCCKVFATCIKILLGLLVLLSKTPDQAGPMDDMVAVPSQHLRNFSVH